MNYTFQLGVALDQLAPAARRGGRHAELAFLGFWGGALIGVVGATAKTFGGPWPRGVAGAYVTFFTNTPALLQIYFFYFGLPEAGILLSSFVAVLLGLTLNAGAYLTEIMRAGFVSVRRTELEAAETLGFSLPQQVRYVILPHVAHDDLPGAGQLLHHPGARHLDGGGVRRRRADRDAPSTSRPRTTAGSRCSRWSPRSTSC